VVCGRNIYVALSYGEDPSEEAMQFVDSFSCFSPPAPLPANSTEVYL